MLRKCMKCETLYGCKTEGGDEVRTCRICCFENKRILDEKKKVFTDCHKSLGNKEETTGLCSPCYQSYCTKAL